MAEAQVSLWLDDALSMLEAATRLAPSPARKACGASHLGCRPACDEATSRVKRRATTAFKMESFAVAHSGSLSHVHTVNFSSSAVDIAREVRLIVTIVVAGWLTVTIARGLLGGFGNRRE
jgi:uncharacterized phage protein gp47/JayE